MSQANMLMNSKSEYNGQKIPRVTIEMGDRVLTTDYQGTSGHAGAAQSSSRSSNAVRAKHLAC